MSHGLPPKQEFQGLQLHLRTLQPQGELLRMPTLSPADAAAAGVLFFDRSGKDL
jgi:hypothetical protein